MANLGIDLLSCGGTSCANTGQSPCDYTMGVIGGEILIPKGRVFTASEILTMQATLVAGGLATSPSARFYPILKFTEMADKSTEAVNETNGYGGMSFVRDGKFGYQFRMNGSNCSWSKLRSFNNKQASYDVLLIDITNNCLVGTKTSAGLLKGFSLELLSVPLHKSNDGKSTFHYFIDNYFLNTREFENKSIVQFDSTTDVSTIITGLIDLNLVGTVTATGLATIQVKSGCGASNASGTFSTNLAQVTAWSAIVDANSTIIPVATATALNPTTPNAAFNVQLTLPAVGILPIGQTFTLSLATPTVLAGAPINMPGYSSCALTLTRI